MRNGWTVIRLLFPELGKAHLSVKRRFENSICSSNFSLFLPTELEKEPAEDQGLYWIGIIRLVFPLWR